MKPPVIPPDRAFAVDGVVDHRVRAALAEARRIRDAWASAVVDAQLKARGKAADELHAQLAALRGFRDQLSADADRAIRERSLRLAARQVGAHFAADPAAVQAQLDAILTARPDWIAVRVPPGTPIEGLGFEVTIDPALIPGELILTGPGGTVDARLSTRLARLEVP